MTAARGALVVVTPDLFGRGGGIARIARSTARACAEYCAEHALDLTVLALGDRGDERDERYLPASADYRGFGGRRLALAAAYLRLATSPRHVATAFCHVNLSVLAAYARVVRRAPYAVVAHGVDVWSPLSRPRVRALRQAREVWPVSEYTGRVVRDLHGVAAEDIRVVHNGLDPLWQEAAPPRASRARPFVLTVARLDRADAAKGVDTLIRAFAAAAAQVPQLDLVVVGSGEDLPRLEALAAASGLADRIALLGMVSDTALATLYAGCLLFALPSAKEGFGLVYLEAMAFGKPVVAARAAASPEIVEDGKTGVLVPFGDVTALAGALVELASSPRAAAQMGENGKRRLLSRFTYGHYRDRVFAGLDALTAATRERAVPGASAGSSASDVAEGR